MITILSIFHNAESYIPRYFEQIRSLKEKPYLLLLEGDSTDNSYELLRQNLKEFNGQLLKRNKGKVYGSVVDERRFKQLAELWNELISLIPNESDYVVFLESDLIWDSETFHFLLELCEDYLFVCPLVEYRGQFYDVWGYRYTETDFFDSSLTKVPTEITELFSAGSFLVMKANIARENKISEKDAVVGFCRTAKEDLFCIPIYVYHP